ncbi:MAG: tRNA pseudouridine(38-40) synthase TruA [Saprospiraceae bacterium]|nr:tRNA pseudouridine(38-40) synthase TruA [Saprospiraceae bacterium]
MRYFVELAYRGTNYQGWQKQPGERPTVQDNIELSLSTLLNQSTAVMGCGRTDTGVHALQYFMHFDFEGELPKNFLYRLNKHLPKDISIFRIIPVDKERHVRFDASHRAYEYRIITSKDPFKIDTAHYYPFKQFTDQDKMQEAAKLLLNYEEFYPFCKSNNDSYTMRCELFHSEWEFKDNEWTFNIAANRFLRGMIRLIVGMCLNVGQDKISLEEVKQALDEQRLLSKSLSVDASGLYLKDIRYPFIQQKDF